MEYVALIITLIKPIIAVALPFAILPLLILIERRGAAYVQDRPGPNRAAINLSVRNILGVMMFRQEAITAIFSSTPAPGDLRLRGFGMFFTITDGIKGVFKQAFTPTFAHRWHFIVAPMIPVACGIMATAVLPWFAPLTFQTASGIQTVSGQALDADAGILVLFAIGSMGVYGVVLGSWASNSKFSLLGGMRASAMMVSYEVSMGLSALSVLLTAGTLSLTGIIDWQTTHTWACFAQPVACFMFLVAIFAECNRTPFDVIEGESELVAGFHTEFGAGKFLAFMSGEYLHVLVASVLFSVLFLGGYSLLPFPVYNGEYAVTLDTNWIRANLALVGGIGLAGAAVGAFFITLLIFRNRRMWAKRVTSDREFRYREFSFYGIIATLACLGAVCGLVAVCALGNPSALAGVFHQGAPVYPLWVVLATAAIQIGVILTKTILMCCLFVWVRWTLPRFRYDQIMALGWKVMLNIALLNLLATAIFLKLFGGAHG